MTGGEASCATSPDCGALDAGSGYACVSGACAPCNLDSRCTASCQPCGGVTPFCLGAFCGQCLTTADCTDGGSCISGGCVVNTPLPDDGGTVVADGGQQGPAPDGGGSIVQILPDGGIQLNPAACCGCRATGGSAASALAGLALLALFFLPTRARRR